MFDPWIVDWSSSWFRSISINTYYPSFHSEIHPLTKNRMAGAMFIKIYSILTVLSSPYSGKNDASSKSQCLFLVSLKHALEKLRSHMKFKLYGAWTTCNWKEFHIRLTLLLQACFLVNIRWRRVNVNSWWRRVYSLKNLTLSFIWQQFISTNLEGCVLYIGCLVRRRVSFKFRHEALAILNDNRSFLYL